MKLLSLQDLLLFLLLLYSVLVTPIVQDHELPQHPAVSSLRRISIFHLIDNKLWGEIDGSGIEGRFPCFESNTLSGTTSAATDGPICEVFTTHHRDQIVDDLKEKLGNYYLEHAAYRKDVLTVMMYHIHTWKTLANPPYRPDQLTFPTNLTIAESEESFQRFQHLFQMSFKHFDGNSTTHPHASVQRSYFRGWKVEEFLPHRPMQDLVKAASFVASTCHRGDSPSKRQHYVTELRKHFRVDGLGKCLHTANIPDDMKLKYGRNEAETLQLKRQAISKYMFYLAFENTIEPGYVTEKVFDALIAGIVPVYLGSTNDCKALIPHPKAVIFISDFQNDMKKLGDYLNYLTSNETAYEEHRAWRKTFNSTNVPDLIKKSWPCRICEWAKSKHEKFVNKA